MLEILAKLEFSVKYTARIEVNFTLRLIMFKKLCTVTLTENLRAVDRRFLVVTWLLSLAVLLANLDVDVRHER